MFSSGQAMHGFSLANTGGITDKNSITVLGYQMKEQWRPVVGYEDMYEISSFGNVRGLDRIIKRCKCGEPLVYKNARPIKWIIRSDGYPRVSLSRDNKYRQFLVHRLVLETFVGKAPKGTEGGHENGIRNDPRLSNLRWDTRPNNHYDRWAHGTMNLAKLTEKQARSIKQSTQSTQYLADFFNMSK